MGEHQDNILSWDESTCRRDEEEYSIPVSYSSEGVILVKIGEHGRHEQRNEDNHEQFYPWNLRYSYID